MDSGKIKGMTHQAVAAQKDVYLAWKYHQASKENC